MTRCCALTIRDAAISSMARVIFFVAWTVRIRPRRILSWPPAITNSLLWRARRGKRQRRGARREQPKRSGGQSRPSFGGQGLVGLGCAERGCIRCHRVGCTRSRRGGVGNEPFLELVDHVTELCGHIGLRVVAHPRQQCPLCAAHVLEQFSLETTHVVCGQAVE